MPGLIVAVVILLIPLILFIAMYNELAALRNHIRDSWANIDTELKRRYDLIPNLVETVKGYAAHERDVLDRVIQLRGQCMAKMETSGRSSAGGQGLDEALLVGAMQRMLAVVENYPELKADRNFLELQRELINTEDRIQAARRFYNGNVRDYRNKREMFPSSIVASMGGFEDVDYFEVEASVREAPQVNVGR